jgi:coenzyme Q-binding protein COQ10
MPAHSEEQVLPYSTQQMFDLVADIERYPEFLPWCRAARMLERGENECMAELVIYFKGMSESYTSRVTMRRPSDDISAGAIDVVMVKGPFQHLTNKWVFTPMPGGGCKIDFTLDFKFKSRIMEMMLGGIFSKATDKMTEAFQERADALYGKK